MNCSYALNALLGDPFLALAALACVVLIFAAGAAAGIAARDRDDTAIAADDAGDTHLRLKWGDSLLRHPLHAGAADLRPYRTPPVRPRMRAIGADVLRPSYDATRQRATRQRATRPDADGGR
jgi:hypothetical protein